MVGSVTATWPSLTTPPCTCQRMNALVHSEFERKTRIALSEIVLPEMLMVVSTFVKRMCGCSLTSGGVGGDRGGGEGGNEGDEGEDGGGSEGGGKSGGGGDKGGGEEGDGGGGGGGKGP